MGCGQSSSMNPDQDPSEVVSLASPRRGSIDGRFAAFISHMKMEAAMEARFIQQQLERRYNKRPVFLDSDDLKDLNDLFTHLANSECVVLVQSRSVLTRPYCLLELYRAIEANVPIVGVTIDGCPPDRSYSFVDAAEFLKFLEHTLDESNPGASDLFNRHGIDILDVAYKLHNRIPNIISLTLNTHASRNMLKATFDDLVTNIDLAKLASTSIPVDRDKWLATRGSRQAKPSCTNAPGPSKWDTIKRLPGSGLLEIAKSPPIPGLSSIAFMLLAVQKASSKAKHMQDECEMFGLVCQHVEQLLIDKKDALSSGSGHNELTSIKECLQKAITAMRPLSVDELDVSTFSSDTFIELCAELHEALMALQAETDVFAQLQGAGKQEQLAVAEELKVECELLQHTVPADADSRTVLEKQNLVLETRVKEMQAMMESQAMQMEAFMNKYPMPANEADRLLVAEKLHLDQKEHLSELDSILLNMGAQLGSSFGGGFVNYLTQSAQKTLSFVYKTKFCGYEVVSGEPEDLIVGDVAAWAEAKFVMPRKLTACQYVVGDQTVRCLRNGIDKQITELAEGLPHLPELVGVLGGVDPGFEPNSLEIANNPDMLPTEAGANAVRAAFAIVWHEQATYYGVPVLVEGQVVATCCACFVGLDTPTREPDTAQKQAIEEATQKVTKVLEGLT